jgi:hypothetical protein
LIAFGAVSMGVGMGQLTKNDAESKTVSGLAAIMGVVGGALIAIGVMLLFLGVGTLPVAIGFIVAGAAALVGGAGSMAAFQPSDVEGWLGLIMGIAGGAMIALGIILCMVGSIPLGVGLIIAGAVALVSAFEINNEELTNQITGWVAVIMGIAGAALLVLGIILTCAGNLPLGIALIAAGAVGLITPIALNWETILEWIKNAWAAIKTFWNEHVAKIFTKEWWLNLAIKAGNGILEGFQGAINGVIGMFENMINWIVRKVNTLSFDVPDWVPGIGGKKFGFNLKEVKFDRVKIPKLAQGAVIPPNKQFLAILGDQKHGTNIEAPLQTIVDAFNIALANNGGASNGSTMVVLEIDGREFGHAVIEQGKRESKRLGTRLVMA